MTSPRRDSSGAELRHALSGLADQIGQDGIQSAIAGLSEMPLESGLVGQTLGDFRIREVLGRGGMGIVFLAEQISVPGRTVALKVLGSAIASVTARQRFEREVQAVGRLDHPNIVPILSADAHGETPFYAMKLVRGRSLRGAIEPGRGTTDVRASVTIVRDLALALQHAHDHGVVHRDVKPGNVLLDEEDRAMLTDFGLASLTETDGQLTMSTDAVGTPDYMAPEQVSRNLGPITARTDVYGLGIVLFELLTGTAPFSAESRHETMNKIVRGDAPALRAVARSAPRDLENICAMAIRREPRARYASAAELAADLQAFLDHRSTVARPPRLNERLGRFLHRHRALAVTGGIALLTFLAAAAWWGVILPAREVEQRLATADELETARDRVIAAAAGADLRQATELRRERDELEQKLQSTFESALSLDPNHAPTLERFAALTASQLQRTLTGGGIMLRSKAIKVLEQRLRRLDTAGRHHELLASTGDLTVTAPQGQATVWLSPTETLSDGRTAFCGIESPRTLTLGASSPEAAPLETTVPEGSYLLRATSGEFTPIELPILIRRRCIQGAAERRVELEFLTPDAIRPGFRQIHGGFGIAYEDLTDGREHADAMTHVPGHQMTVRESGYADIDRWIENPTDPERAAKIAKLPRPTYREVSWNAITYFLGRMNTIERRDRTGYYTALPSPEEWQRAARGADGRPYPWGWLHDWTFSQNYRSATTADEELLPYDFPTADTSPYGIRDMAGSQREVCMPMNTTAEIGTKQFLLCGGSFYSFQSADLRLDSVRTLVHNEPAPDAGLRLVRRPLPIPPRGPRTLRLADTNCLDWRLTTVRGPFFENHPPGARTRFVEGVFEVNGYAGNFSPELLAWHSIESSDHFELRATWTHSFDGQSGNDRGMRFVLGQTPGLDHFDERIDLFASTTSWYICHEHRHRVVEQHAIAEGSRLQVTLRCDGAQLTAKLTVDDGEPRQLQLPWNTKRARTFRYLGIRLPSLCRTRARIHELEFLPR